MAAILGALGQLGVAETRDDVEAFVRLYHGETTSVELDAALAAGINAVAAIDASAGRTFLQEVAGDGSYRAPLRDLARGYLAGSETAASGTATASTTTTTASTTTTATTTTTSGSGTTEAAASVEATETGTSSETATPTESTETVAPAPTLPPQLTTEMAQELLEPVMGDIRACMRSGGVDSMRLVLVVNPNGSWAAVSTSPLTVFSCVNPLVRSREMPAVSSRLRQRLSFVVRAQE